MEINKLQFTKLFLLLPILSIIQSCTSIYLKDDSTEKVVQGRFSLVFLKHNQSTQGRFVWKISRKYNSRIEEFFFMDPWGKTRGILVRRVEKNLDPWALLNPNHQPIEKKYIENWLRKEFEITSIELNSLISPINIASTEVEKYYDMKNKVSIIKVVTETKLGKILMNLLPDK